MTENEAKNFLGRFSLDRIGYANGKEVDVERFDYFSEVLVTAMKALEEIQKYRAIGTVEECSKLKEYEEIGTPNEIRAKLCFLITYKRADSDGRFMLILDKNGYCEELGGLHIDEIRKRCLEREEKKD